MLHAKMLMNGEFAIKVAIQRPGKHDLRKICANSAQACKVSGSVRNPKQNCHRSTFDINYK